MLPAWHSVLQAVTNYTNLVNQNLRNQVTYQVWFIARDVVGNVQTQPTSVSVTTVRTAPPIFQSLLVQYIPPTTAYVEVSLPSQIPVGRSKFLVLSNVCRGQAWPQRAADDNTSACKHMTFTACPAAGGHNVLLLRDQAASAPYKALVRSAYGAMRAVLDALTTPRGHMCASFISLALCRWCLMSLPPCTTLECSSPATKGRPAPLLCTAGWG